MPDRIDDVMAQRLTWVTARWTEGYTKVGDKAAPGVGAYLNVDVASVDVRDQPFRIQRIELDEGVDFAVRTATVAPLLEFRREKGIELDAVNDRVGDAADQLRALGRECREDEIDALLTWVTDPAAYHIVDSPVRPKRLSVELARAWPRTSEPRRVIVPSDFVKPLTNLGQFESVVAIPDYWRDPQPFAFPLADGPKITRLLKDAPLTWERTNQATEVKMVWIDRFLLADAGNVCTFTLR